MNRRQVLQALTAGGVVAAGCLSEPVATDQTPKSQPRTTTDGGTLSILSVETHTTVLRLNDLGSAPRASIPDRSELDDREQEVVSSAIESSYETDEVPEWLAKFANGTRFVRAGGEYYQLHTSFPIYTITAEPISEDEVSGAIASNEEYRDAVTHDGVRMTGLLRIAQEEGFRTIYIWPSLREFLDDYDAVRYWGELLGFEETIDDPGPPYEITAEQASLDEVADGPVWVASDAPNDLQQIVRAAGSKSGTYSLDEPPEGLLENLEDHEYVYLNGTFYTTYVENENPHDVAIHAEAILGDGEDATPRIRLAIHNEADGPVEIMSGAPAPFGVVHCYARDAPDGTRHLIWSDAYEENRHVHTEGRDVVAVNDIGLITELGPGEEIGREFEIPSDLASGEYVVDSGVGVEYADREGGSLSFRVHFRIE